MTPCGRSAAAFPFALILAALCLACGSGGSTSGDAGRGDGGARSDGGARDGGAALDGAASQDAGVRADGGAQGDGGSLVDAGVRDGGASVDGGGVDAGVTTCTRALAPADRARKVVVSHPYNAMSRAANRYEVMTLSATGELSRAGSALFDMGRSIEGDIVFTPDGELGLVAQEDGSIGVFRLGSGAPEVIHARFRDGFYASRIVVAADGATALVLDANFPENGGGLYRVAIGCDGRLQNLGKVFASKLLYGLARLASGEWLAVARELLGSPQGEMAHRLSAAETPARLGGVDPFGDEEAIVSALALSRSGRYALIGDNNSFSGLPNRIAVVELADGGLRRAQVVTPLNDPVAIVASPFDESALVASGFGNAIFRLRHDATSASNPYVNAGALTYRGARPQLPANAVLIERGPLRGRVLVSENLGVRQVQFEVDGGVTDLGLTSTGTGSEAIVGIVGVQP